MLVYVIGELMCIGVNIALGASQFRGVESAVPPVTIIDQ